MKKDLFTLLRKTKPVALKNEVVRTLDEAELASVVGGMMATRSNSCSGGCEDDCCD
jgi:hypothetical protein